MTSLMGQVGELSFTVQVTRKDTGQVETYELVGQITDDQAEDLGLKAAEETKDDHGSHA